MEKRIKRFLSLALAMVLVIGLMPMGHVSAEDSSDNLNYRWEPVTDADGNTTLVSVSGGGFTENALTNVKGTVSEEGLLSAYTAKFTDTVTLAWDKPWVIEWEAAGKFMGFLLSTKSTSASDGNYFLWANGNDSLSLSRYVGSSNYHNFITAKSLIADATIADKHVFRLENRLTTDESGNVTTNTIYLVMDGGEGRAINTNTSGEVQNNYDAKTDITFNYIGSGTTKYYVDGLTLNYLEIYVNGECDHTYGTPTLSCSAYTRTCSTCGYVDKQVYAYRWEQNADGKLQSVSTSGSYTENSLTNVGTTSNIVYKMSNGVALDNSEPWVITFEASGSGAWHSMLLSKTKTAQTAGNQYLFLNKGSFILGYCDTDKNWKNVVSLGGGSTLINGNEHVCSLVNNVDTAQIDVYIDGTYVSSVDRSADLGDTLEFNYIGAATTWGVPSSDDPTLDFEYMEIYPHGQVEHSGDWTKSCYDYVRDCTVCGTHETKDLISYRWEPVTDADGNTTLESINGDGYTGNALKNVSGSVNEDGLLTDYHAQFTDTVNLSASEPWVIQWEAKGMSSCMLLSRYATYSKNGNYYVWLKESGVLTLSKYQGGNTHNDMKLTDAAPDYDTAFHTYSLKNEVTEDGNMIYLYIDGVKIRAINTTSTGTIVNNYTSGTDIVYNFIGASSSSTTGQYYIKNMTLKYLEIHLNGEIGHTWNEWAESSDGEVSHTCTNCSETETAVAGVVGADGTVSDYYVDVADAVADANALSGSTVKLVGDVTTDEVLYLSCSLDLNGHSLTAASVTAMVSSKVYDSVGTGLLVVAQDKLAILNTGNPAVPVWNGTAYVLANLEKINTKAVVDYTNNTAAYYFQPVIGSNAHDALKLGKATSGVMICVTVSWTVDGYPGSKTFNVTDELVKDYLAGYNSDTETFKYAFKLSLSGVENVDEDSLSFSSKVVSQYWPTDEE